MSQRQAAKALGVGKGTIQRDLVDQNGPQSGPERSTKAERRAQRERELASKRM
jgi:transposase